MQPKNPTADRTVTPHPTSPWTELFQSTSPQPEPKPTPTDGETERSHATGADSARATQDALAVIFNTKQ